MKNNYTNLKRSSGFSLVELMLAMLIGTIIMGGVMQLFVTTRDTQRTSEDQLALLGDARFAIESISYDLRHAGVWGRHNNPQLIACNSNAATAYPCPAGVTIVDAAGDCAAREYINFDMAIFGANDTNPYADTCAQDSYLAGTDVLSVRYADTNWIATADLEADVAYVRSNIRSGVVFKAAAGAYPAAPGFYKWDDVNATSNHLLVSRTYYVSDYTDEVGDGLPSLRRVGLTAGPALVSETVLPGVENFQIEYGVDRGINGAPSAERDGEVDRYVNADAVGSWVASDVVSVKIWVLMRSERKDRNAIGGAQTFTIAGTTFTAADDGYRRYLVSSVVKLRNTLN